MRFQRLAAFALLALSTACASSSPYLGMNAEQVWARAEAEFQDGDWDDAIEALDVLAASFPTWERMADARMLMAKAYFNDKKYFTASQEFSRFLERYPRDERASEAALLMCRSYVELSPIPPRDQTYTEQAARVCQQVVSDWTGRDDDVARQASDYVNEMRAKLAEKAFDRADFYYDRELWDSSIIEFQRVVDDYADTDWAPRALARIVAAYQEIGYQDEVERARQQLLNSYPDSPEAKAAAEATADDGGAGDTLRVADMPGVATRGDVPGPGAVSAPGVR